MSEEIKPERAQCQTINIRRVKRRMARARPLIKGICARLEAVPCARDGSRALRSRGSRRLGPLGPASASGWGKRVYGIGVRYDRTQVVWDRGVGSGCRGLSDPTTVERRGEEDALLAGEWRWRGLRCAYGLGCGDKIGCWHMASVDLKAPHLSVAPLNLSLCSLFSFTFRSSLGRRRALSVPERS